MWQQLQAVPAAALSRQPHCRQSPLPPHSSWQQEGQAQQMQMQLGRRRCSRHRSGRAPSTAGSSRPLRASRRCRRRRRSSSKDSTLHQVPEAASRGRCAWCQAAALQPLQPRPHRPQRQMRKMSLLRC
jgi:hypothetical protein